MEFSIINTQTKVIIWFLDKKDKGIYKRFWQLDKTIGQIDFDKDFKSLKLYWA